MAATQVFSIDTSLLQSVSWSQDDRIAINSDKDIVVLTLETLPTNCSGECRVAVKVTLSANKLAAKPVPWPDLELSLVEAKRQVRSQFLKKWTWCSLAVEDQVSNCWTCVVWSPLAVAFNGRSVLAAVTRNHHLVIFGQSSTQPTLTQLADIGEQLFTEHQTDFVSQYTAVNSHSQRLTTVYSQMASVAPTQVEWSSPFCDADGRPLCVLLFVAVKNGDIITCVIRLPLTDRECCSFVDRQKAETEQTVTALAWTTLTDSYAGVLAVGYADGKVTVNWYHYDPSVSPGRPECRCSQKIHPHSDFMPVSSLTWMRSDQLGLVLLCTKETVTLAFTLTVDDRSDSGEGADGKGWISVTGASHVRLGNWLPAVGIQCVGQTVVMAAQDGQVLLLSVGGTITEPKVEVVRQIPFQHEESGWGCVAVRLSLHASLCLVVFRPNFDYNYLLDRFRCPVKVHICAVPSPGMTSVQQLLASNVETDSCMTDILECGRLMLCQEMLTTDTVGQLVSMVTASTHTDSLTGCRLARHLLRTLRALCKAKKLTTAQEKVEAAERRMVDRLMCQRVCHFLDTLSKTKDSKHTDGASLNTMLNWVRWSNERVDLVGSKAMTLLTSTVSQPQPDTCVLCDGEMEYSGSLSVTCANKHTFGLCCHTLSVCNSAPYQCCGTCGALALATKQLTGLSCMTNTPGLCGLCGSFMYSSSSSLGL